MTRRTPPRWRPVLWDRPAQLGFARYAVGIADPDATEDGTRFATPPGRALGIWTGTKADAASYAARLNRERAP